MAKISILVFLALVCVAYSAKKGENCEQKILEDCANHLFMLGDDSFVFPTKIEQMNKRCKDIKPLEKCVKDYTARCMDGTTRSSLSVVIYGVIKTNKAYCASSARKNAFVGFGTCVNANRQKLDRYLAEMNRDFHGAKIYKDPKLRIPLACCNYYKFKARAIDQLNGSGKCKESQVREVEALVDGYARDGLNLLCGDYVEESDKCEGIVGKTPKWTKALHTNAFIQSLADILNSI